VPRRIRDLWCAPTRESGNSPAPKPLLPSPEGAETDPLHAPRIIAATQMRSALRRLHRLLIGYSFVAKPAPIGGQPSVAALL
jgi:hypothetical protein